MFNPYARWDRDLPLENNSDLLNEPIVVGAVFSKTKIRPIYFIRKNKKIFVKKLTYYWQDRRGKEIIHYFSLTDGINIYYICFNNITLSWRLLNICPE